MTTTLVTIGATELTGHPDDKWGWAGQLALAIKNIPTGAGDVINVQGVYTDGATRYNIQDLAGAAGASQIYNTASPAPGAYESVALAVAPDSVFGSGHRAEPGPDLGYAWCVQPQLRSLLERCDLRCLRFDPL